jgi:hypothetical protein
MHGFSQHFLFQDQNFLLFLVKTFYKTYIASVFYLLTMIANIYKELASKTKHCSNQDKQVARSFFKGVNS